MTNEVSQLAHEPRSMSTAFPSLDAVTRPVVGTAQAAHYLFRSQQTLRLWACNEDGPLRPVRVGKRLGWKVEDIRRVLGVA
jgi:hypothetical protein